MIHMHVNQIGFPRLWVPVVVLEAAYVSILHRNWIVDYPITLLAHTLLNRDLDLQRIGLSINRWLYVDRTSIRR